MKLQKCNKFFTDRLTESNKLVKALSIFNKGQIEYMISVIIFKIERPCKECIELISVINTNDNNDRRFIRRKESLAKILKKTALPILNESFNNLMKLMYESLTSKDKKSQKKAIDFANKATFIQDCIKELEDIKF